MRVGEAFPSKYLSAVDLKGRSVVVTISKYSIEKFDDGPKPVLWFSGKEKGLCLNKTNANMIEELLGTDEMDDWKGKSITVYPTKVDYQGKRVDAIRVEDTLPTGGKAAPPKPEPEPDPFETDDDSVPF
jgi:hypothetical protein